MSRVGARQVVSRSCCCESQVLCKHPSGISAARTCWNPANEALFLLGSERRHCLLGYVPTRRPLCSGRFRHMSGLIVFATRSNWRAQPITCWARAYRPTFDSSRAVSTRESGGFDQIRVGSTNIGLGSTRCRESCVCVCAYRSEFVLSFNSPPDGVVERSRLAVRSIDPMMSRCSFAAWPRSSSQFRSPLWLFFRSTCRSEFEASCPEATAGPSSSACRGQRQAAAIKPASSGR